MRNPKIKLATYVREYIEQEMARDRSLKTNTILDAIDAFESGAFDGNTYEVTVKELLANEDAA